jgi:hypothetical protein
MLTVNNKMKFLVLNGVGALALLSASSIAATTSVESEEITSTGQFIAPIVIDDVTNINWGQIVLEDVGECTMDKDGGISGAACNNTAANANGALNSGRTAGGFTFTGEIGESVLVALSATLNTDGDTVSTGLSFAPVWTNTESSSSSGDSGQKTYVVQANNTFIVHGILTVAQDASADVLTKVNLWDVTANVTYN